jgi:hypothetical protein
LAYCALAFFNSFWLHGHSRFVSAEALMFRMISPKALIVSNLAHWIIFVTGSILAICLYAAGATISSDGALTLKAVFGEMKSSSGLLAVTALIFLLAPIPAGYIAAKIAPHEKLLNGALSVSAWLLLSACDAIWGGSGSADSTAHIPRWLDALTTCGAPIPAMLGAYIWYLRADRGVFTTADAHQNNQATSGPQHEAAPLPSMTKPNRARRFGRTGTGLGTFVFLLMQLLLTGHERDMLLLAMLVALILFIVVAFALKAFKSTSG